MACKRTVIDKKVTGTTSMSLLGNVELGNVHELSHSVFYKIYRVTNHTGRSAFKGIQFISDIIRKFWRFALSECCIKIADSMRSLSELKKSRIGRGELSISRTFFRIIKNAADEIRYAYRVFTDEGLAAGFQSLAKQVREAAGRFWLKNKRALNYLAPVAGVAVLAATLYLWSGMTFALSVDYNGKAVGIVASEKVYREAVDSIETKVSDASGESFCLNKSPDFKIVVAKKSDLANEDNLYDSILLASGNQVNKAYGLYVDNRLVGANSDSTAIQTMLDNILASYKNDSRNQQISFVQDISIKSGVFPSNVMKSTQNMQAILTANAANAKNYTAQKGDSALKVANMFHISVDQLYAMNTSLNSTGINQGQTIQVVNDEPTLSVKVIRNEVSTQSIPYQVQQTQSDKVDKGKTKVVTSGQAGVMQVVSTVSYINNSPVSSNIVSTTLLKAPVTEQVLVGTKTSSSKSSKNSSSGAMNYSNGGSGSSDVVGYAENYLGVTYLPGGATPGGFDCSGFTQYVYAKMGVSLAHSAAAQSQTGSSVSKSGLQAGDLVFFDTNGGHNGVNHVGIYIGGGNFIQACSTHPYGITINNLNESYYQKTYMSARRVR